jgi:hypothetical protein
MKLGAENSKKTLAAGVLLIIALLLFIRMLAGGSSSGNGAAASSAVPQLVPTVARRSPARRAGRTAEKSAGPVTPSLDPRLHLALLNETESLDYTGKGRNIFKAQMDEPIPTPVAPAMVESQKPIGPEPPPPPPPPPPINLKFFGFVSGSGAKRVFLSQGDDVFVASEGDIVQRRYKIMKINSGNVEVLDVLSNNRQTIPLTADKPAGS